MNRDTSSILTMGVGLIHPFILLFGFYLIAGGAHTPGGGFQGGAVLATVFMSRYIALPHQPPAEQMLQRIEKFFFLMLLLFVSLFGVYHLIPAVLPRTTYLFIANVIIGVKVCCGLSLIFQRFIGYESGE
jgi:multicomponent Na+:H+ antiporter subunit B